MIKSSEHKFYYWISRSQSIPPDEFLTNAIDEYIEININGEEIEKQIVTVWCHLGFELRQSSSKYH